MVTILHMDIKLDIFYTMDSITMIVWFVRANQQVCNAGVDHFYSQNFVSLFDSYCHQFAEFFSQLSTGHIKS